MNPTHLVVDGYCLLHRDPDTAPLINADLARARRILVRKTEALAGALAERITVVFDGQSAGPAEEHENVRVRVRFTARNQSADSFIQRLAYEDPAPDQLAVVTSDRAIMDSVLACGGQIISCAEFLDRCRDHTLRTRRAVKQTQVRRRHTLGDHFPK